MLQLSHCHYKAMEGHALAVYPEECCGLILGLLEDCEGRRAMEIWPVSNAWTPRVEVEHRQTVHGHYESAGQANAPTGVVERSAPKHSQRDRFSIDPRDLLKAQKYARRQGWDIIGIYHSHPDHVAEPSERDRQSAWPQYSYLILSVHPGHVSDCKSWRLNDQALFEPEPWQL